MSAMMQSTMMGAKLVVPTRGAPKAGRSAVVCSASAEDARRAVRHPGAHAFYSAARVRPPGHASRPLAASLEQLDTGVWPYSPSDGAWAPRQVVSLVAAASVTLGVVGAAFADGATYAPLQDDTKKNAGVFLVAGPERHARLHSSSAYQPTCGSYCAPGSESLQSGR
jgi:hypothetical protein